MQIFATIHVNCPESNREKRKSASGSGNHSRDELLLLPIILFRNLIMHNNRTRRFHVNTFNGCLFRRYHNPSHEFVKYTYHIHI